MKKAAAATAAFLGLAMTATGALAATSLVASSHASPVSVLAQDKTAVGGPNNNHGGAVSTLAKGTNGAPAPTTDTTTGTTGTAGTTNAGTQGAHGAAVSAVAQDKTAVGGPNNNHGGAVSAVARGTHGSTGTHGSSGTHGTTGKGHGKD
jgi:hypothetical protein